MRDAASELLGTFVFVSVALLSGGDPVLAAAGLLAALVFARRMGPGHLNPAVSTAMYLSQKVPTSRYIAYVAAQLLGAIGALAWTSLASRR